MSVVCTLADMIEAEGWHEVIGTLRLLAWGKGRQDVAEALTPIIEIIEDEAWRDIGPAEPFAFDGDEDQAEAL